MAKKEKEENIEGLEGYSPEMKKKILKELKKRERRRKLLIFSFALMGAAFLGYFAYYYLSAGKKDKESGTLSALKGSDVLKTKQGGTAEYLAKLSGRDTEAENRDILDKYLTLYNKNKDIIGWIKIDGTIIDYPVMQTGDNEYYLDHNFDKKDDRAGCIFLDCRCDVKQGNDNLILYGHHLTSGRMFSGLSEYEKESYYKNHPYIYFDTIYKEGTYQVMYAFRSRVYDATDVNFKYYDFIDAASEEEFTSYMNEMKEASYYDTGVTASFGDELLTLSTCDYKEENGRFAVVAKRIR